MFFHQSTRRSQTFSQPKNLSTGGRYVKPDFQTWTQRPRRAAQGGRPRPGPPISPRVTPISQAWRQGMGAWRRGCGRCAQSASTRLSEQGPRERGGGCVCLGPGSAHPHWHYPRPPSCPSFPVLVGCYGHFIARAERLPAEAAPTSPKPWPPYPRGHRGCLQGGVPGPRQQGARQSDGRPNAPTR